MKVLVAGSGAMGSTWGHILHKAGNDVTLVDKWKENVEKTNSEGLTITDVNVVEKSPLKMYYPEEVTGDFDLVLFFCKSYQLEDMIESVKHLVKDNTKVLCILNGLGHLNTLRKHFADKHILMGVTVVTAKLLGPANFLISAHSNTDIKNIDPNEKEACLKVVKMFNDATMPFTYVDDIMYATWKKAMLNGTTNCICALLDCNMITQGNMPGMRDVVREIVSEFAMVAKFEDNVNFNVEELTDTVMFFLSEKFAGCMHFPSMHQDLVTNRRKTEIDYLNGYVAEKAKKHGSRAPYSELIAHLVRGKESALNIK